MENRGKANLRIKLLPPKKCSYCGNTSIEHAVYESKYDHGSNQIIDEKKWTIHAIDTGEKWGDTGGDRESFGKKDSKLPILIEKVFPLFQKAIIEIFPLRGENRMLETVSDEKTYHITQIYPKNCEHIHEANVE